MNFRSDRLRLGACVALVLALIWIAYLPGLSGGFHFDDHVNLDALGATGPVYDWPTFWRYITSGTADPIGRPMALLSFLIDARDWPADPSPFLRTNLVLHIANSALLFAFLRQLGNTLASDRRRNAYAAVLAAGIWALHPLFVSTTLYVVQREAMLPVGFMLAGLIAYTHGRSKLAIGIGYSGEIWMAAGIGLGTLFAMLSKSNGVLLPLLAWTIEATVFSSSGEMARLGQQGARRLNRVKWVLLIAPSLLLLAYLALRIPGMNTEIAGRPWTTGQRLLTEPAILLEYLRLLFVPSSMSSGLYNDHYEAARSLLDPLTTLPAMLAIIGLLIAGIRMRRRMPRLSAAILFFLAGHVLESTIIPLELYFEHRNYLPSLLLFWPISHALVNWKIGVLVRSAIGCSLIALCAWTTFNRAQLWGDPQKLAQIWAQQNPDSSRAQSAAGIALVNAGRPELASEQLARLWAARPRDSQLALNFVDATCRWRNLTPEEKVAIARALESSSNAIPMIRLWLDRAIDVTASGGCGDLSMVELERWIEAFSRNPDFRSAATRASLTEPLLARIALARNEPDVALVHFNRSIELGARPDTAALNIAHLASSGYHRQALDHLDYYERMPHSAPSPASGMQWVHAQVVNRQQYWPREMKILREKLNAEIASTGNPSPGGGPP